MTSNLPNFDDDDHPNHAAQEAAQEAARAAAREATGAAAREAAWEAAWEDAPVPGLAGPASRTPERNTR